jgi:predicted TPR repeat methyltransferase
MNEPKTVRERIAQGRVLIDAGRFDDARRVFGEICETGSENAEAWFLLGAIAGQFGDMAEAARCSSRAAALAPEYADAHFNLGLALRRLGRPAEAEKSLRRVTMLRPEHAQAWDNLGYVLNELGRRDEAIRCYREALRLRPDFAGTSYLLAAIDAAPVPAAAPPEYVRGLFDNYASHFDESLVGNLHYRPGNLVDLALPFFGEARAALDVMDIGCGTGLCGPLVRPYARQLIGVDLAPRMLERAGARGCYDVLVESDAAAALDARPGSFDLIVAADVFAYIGDLAVILRAAQSALRRGGMIAFSAEAEGDETTYRLRSTSRYAHGAPYIRRVAAVARLRERAFQETLLRRQNGEPVAGFLFVLERAD